MIPTIGRIVHYVIFNGKHRAAIVVDVTDTEALMPNIDLQVFLTPSEACVFNASDRFQWVPVARFSETMEPGTWHWPER